MNNRFVQLLSVMYAVFLIVLGAIITVRDTSEPTNNTDHIYNILITLVGMAFLVFIHYDVYKHKRFVMRWERKRKTEIESPMRGSECDTISVATAIIFNRNWNIHSEDIDEGMRKALTSYKFLTGKHSGSFYLKIGMMRTFQTVTIFSI